MSTGIARLQQEDPERFEREKKARIKMRDSFEFYAPRALKIRPKKGPIVPFTLNNAQRHLHERVERQLKETGKIRVLVLKGRQQGISTYVEGRFYWKVSHRKGVRAFILTHEDAATQNLFEMVARYHNNCLEPFRPETGSANAKELYFKRLDSGYKVGTAGTKGVGRSSTLQYFHGSEVAFWPHADSHAMGVIQAVPREDDTEIFLESTANGIGNYFHHQWQLAENGESEYIAVFLPWYWQPEYRVKVVDGFQLTPDEVDLLDQFGEDGLTIEHLAWRRIKIAELSTGGEEGDWRFKQEYPFTAAEAFQTSGENSLIDPKVVIKARKSKVQASGAKIIGVDPARFGDDRTAIVFRQGRLCAWTKTYKKKSTMEVAGICARLLRDSRTGKDTDIDMMFIDVGGLRAGVVDRLMELGFEDRIKAVNSAESALEDERYSNKRAEMWGEMNEWLCSMNPAIPDDDALQADLCGPTYSYDSASRLLIEKKEKMKARGLRSPDIGDALALTFAYPVAAGQRFRRPTMPEFNPIDPLVGY